MLNAHARVALRDLHVGAELGSGAQGSVFAICEPGPSDTPFPVVLKRFRADVNAAALEHLTTFRQHLDDRERSLLDEHSTWPYAVVEDGGTIVGYLMRTIPEPFWQTIASTTGDERIPREVQHLFLSDVLARRNLGETATMPERRALALRLARVLDLLHRHHVVFGDLSYRNAVYAIRPTIGLMLLDCDAARQVGSGGAVAQLHSPGWTPPEGGPATLSSDRYKFALFVLRVLTPGTNAQNRDPGAADHVLDRSGRRLLRETLQADPRERPPMSRWVAHLEETAEDSGAIVARRATAPRPSPPPASARAPHEPPPSSAPHAPHRRPASRRATRRTATPPRSARVQRPRSRKVHPSQVHSASHAHLTPSTHGLLGVGGDPSQPFTNARLKRVLLTSYFLFFAILGVAIGIAFAVTGR